MIRKCPYCYKSVSIWSVIKPALWKDSHIKCNHCKKTISKYWSDTPFTLWLVLGVGMYFFIEWLHFGFMIDMFLILSTPMVLLGISYVFIPLCKYENLEK
jgi:hypothetical protein